MANATNPLVGRSVGHERAVFMATSGHFYWPPVGTSEWPLTGDLASRSLLNDAEAWASAVRTARAGGEGWEVNGPDAN